MRNIIFQNTIFQFLWSVFSSHPQCSLPVSSIPLCVCNNRYPSKVSSLLAFFWSSSKLLLFSVKNSVLQLYDMISFNIILLGDSYNDCGYLQEKKSSIMPSKTSLKPPLTLNTHTILHPMHCLTHSYFGLTSEQWFNYVLPSFPCW